MCLLCMQAHAAGQFAAATYLEACALGCVVRAHGVKPLQRIKVLILPQHLQQAIPNLHSLHVLELQQTTCCPMITLGLGAGKLAQAALHQKVARIPWQCTEHVQGIHTTKNHAEHARRALRRYASPSAKPSSVNPASFGTGPPPSLSLQRLLGEQRRLHCRQAQRGHQGVERHEMGVRRRGRLALERRLPACRSSLPLLPKQATPTVKTVHSSIAHFEIQELQSLKSHSSRASAHARPGSHVAMQACSLLCMSRNEGLSPPCSNGLTLAVARMQLRHRIVQHPCGRSVRFGAHALPPQTGRLLPRTSLQGPGDLSDQALRHLWSPTRKSPRRRLLWERQTRECRGSQLLCNAAHPRVCCARGPWHSPCLRSMVERDVSIRQVHACIPELSRKGSNPFASKEERPKSSCRPDPGD